jgi:hypothetical protein
VTKPAFDSPGDLPAPMGYSHVVSIPAGRLVWTSGQVGIAADGQAAQGWRDKPDWRSRTWVVRWRQAVPDGTTWSS